MTLLFELRQARRIRSHFQMKICIWFSKVFEKVAYIKSALKIYSFMSEHKVFSVLSKPIQPSKIQTDNPLQNRNSHFLLNYVQGVVNVFEPSLKSGTKLNTVFKTGYSFLVLQK